MKDYNIKSYIPSSTPGRPDVLVREKYLRVYDQRNSPVIDGKLTLVANPLRYIRFSQSMSPGHFKWSWDIDTTYDLIPYIDPIDDYWLRSTYQPLLTENENKLVLKIQAFGTNMIEIYRTRKETIDMVTSTVKKLTYIYKSIRQRNFRNACNLMGISYRKPSKRNHNNPPGAWLEYTYGWSPLVSDMYVVLNQTFPELRHYVFSRQRETLSLLLGEDSNKITKYEGQIRVSASCEVVVNDSTVKAISYYGIDNPSLALWEAMPYSFIVDWFLPVGDYLQSLTAFNGISVRNFSHCISANYSATQTLKGDDPPTNMITLSNGSASMTGSTVYRYIGEPAYRFPSLQNGLSLNRFATALSLLAVTFQRKL